MKKIVAIIPARGGSKSIPGKNTKLLAGKPLIAWSIEAALACPLIQETVVSTDDKHIADTAIQYGAKVITRPAELALDETPMDPVLKHAVTVLGEQGHIPDSIILLQPTSPLRKTQHINEALQKFLGGDFDSLVSIEILRNPHHELVQDRYLVPTFTKIQNRDKRKPIYMENGAIYISKTELIKKGRIRGDRIGFYEMDRYASIDIDEPKDFAAVERLLNII